TTIDRDKIFDALNGFMPADRVIPKKVVSSIAELTDGDKALLAHTAMLSLGRYATDEELQEMFADSNDRALVTTLKGADIDEDRFFAALDSGGGWVRSTLTYLAQTIISSERLGVEEEQSAIQRLALSIARSVPLAADGDEA